jgi:hypothetical protein
MATKVEDEERSGSVSGSRLMKACRRGEERKCLGLSAPCPARLAERGQTAADYFFLNGATGEDSDQFFRTARRLVMARSVTNSGEDDGWWRWRWGLMKVHR